MIIKRFFSSIGALLKFINNHIKALLFLLLIGWIFSQSTSDTTKPPNLAQVELHGAIEDAKSWVESLHKLQVDKNIKGVLLHVDSPGGALGPSVEAMLAVKALVKAKPVVVYGAGTMASGSYYASIHATHIVANPGAFVGSIGVLFQSPNIKPLADKIGIEEQIITAGKFKQMGTFTRPWENHEKDALQNLVDKAYSMFVKDVATARGLEEKSEGFFAQGKLFLAEDAKELGLVDSVGGWLEAKELLVALSGVDTPHWKEPSAFDKALAKLGGSAKTWLGGVSYGLKAY
ncbi:MAG: signal peptide peptidase SppA [Campylobacteraceae bacterium]|nr:signal peptide peptidase SppA [Campylobacteraceae bacterium]